MRLGLSLAITRGGRVDAPAPHQQILAAAQAAGALAVYNPDDPTTLDTREDGSDLYAEELRDGLGNLPPLKQTSAGKQLQIVTNSKGRREWLSAHASDNFMATEAFPAPMSQPNTVLTVARRTFASDGATADLFDSLSGTRQNLFHSSSTLRMFAGTAPRNTTVLAPDTYSVYQALFDGPASGFSLNGAAYIAVGDPGSNQMTGLTLAQVATLESRGWGGLICMVIVFDGSKSVADLAALRAVINDLYPIGESS